MENKDKKRKCWQCKTEYPITKFFFYKDYTDKSGFQKSCKECQKKRALKYNVEHREYFKKKGKERYKKEDNKARYQKYKVEYLKRKDKSYRSVRGRLYELLESARYRAKNKNLEINIDLDYLCSLFEQQSGKCILTNIKFIFERAFDFNRRYSPFGPSIDKIDCKKGYTKDNVRLICVIANLALNEFGDGAFDKMCQSYIDKKMLTINKKQNKKNVVYDNITALTLNF